MGLLWQSSGYDSALPLQGVWVQSPVWERRSRRLHIMGKNKTWVIKLNTLGLI